MKTTQRVAQIFRELKPLERALLWLAYVEGESHDEIATSLGVGRRAFEYCYSARGGSYAICCRRAVFW